MKLGLEGALNITDAMESLSQSLTFNKVPDTWEKKAYFSKKTLNMWFIDLLDRVKQLDEWTEAMETPKSLCISYLFNPMSFLTAIVQNTSRQTNQALDQVFLSSNSFKILH